jgi:hypothetical protein
MDRDDQYLLQWCSAINFDNRLLTTVDPIMTNRGTIWRGVAPLDFNLVSGITKRSPPAWDYVWDFPAQVLQLVEIQNISGVRAFIVGFDEDEVLSVWEISTDKKKDDDLDISSELITRSFQFEKPLTLKTLQTSDMWLTELSGNVQVDAYYRGDLRECWSRWGRYSETFVNCKSTPNRPTGCLPTLFVRPPVRSRVGFGEAQPDASASCEVPAIPTNQAYEFQVRLKLTGYWKLRRFRLLANEAIENIAGSIQNDCTEIPLTECETCATA